MSFNSLSHHHHFHIHTQDPSMDSTPSIHCSLLWSLVLLIPELLGHFDFTRPIQRLLEVFRRLAMLAYEGVQNIADIESQRRETSMRELRVVLSVYIRLLWSLFPQHTLAFLREQFLQDEQSRFKEIVMVWFLSHTLTSHAHS